MKYGFLAKKVYAIGIIVQSSTEIHTSISSNMKCTNPKPVTMELSVQIRTNCSPGKCSKH